MAIEKAHDPWRDSIAGATVDWGETISGCGAEECLGRLRRGHVMDVIYVMLRVEQIPGEAEARRSCGESTCNPICENSVKLKKTGAGIASESEQVHDPMQKILGP